jgi:hypothetical protein
MKRMNDNDGFLVYLANDSINPLLHSIAIHYGKQFYYPWWFMVLWYDKNKIHATNNILFVLSLSESKNKHNKFYKLLMPNLHNLNQTHLSIRIIIRTKCHQKVAHITVSVWRCKSVISNRFENKLALIFTTDIMNLWVRTQDRIRYIHH